MCDDCWRDRERLYLERKQREAAEVKNPNRVAAGKRARMAAKGLDLPATLLSRVGRGIHEALPQESSFAPFADQNGVLDDGLQFMTPDSTDEFVKLANQHPDHRRPSRKQLTEMRRGVWTKVPELMILYRNFAVRISPR
jgi:hypothetical protein